MLSSRSNLLYYCLIMNLVSRGAVGFYRLCYKKWMGEQINLRLFSLKVATSYYICPPRLLFVRSLTYNTFSL